MTSLRAITQGVFQFLPSHQCAGLNRYLIAINKIIAKVRRPGFQVHVERSKLASASRLIGAHPLRQRGRSKRDVNTSASRSSILERPITSPMS